MSVLLSMRHRPPNHGMHSPISKIPIPTPREYIIYTLLQYPHIGQSSPFVPASAGPMIQGDRYNAILQDFTALYTKEIQ